MNRMTSRNQKNRPNTAMEKPFDEIHKLSSSDPPLHRHEPILSLSAYAEMMFKPNRASVLLTTGVSLFFATTWFLCDDPSEDPQYQRLLFMPIV
jgi:hypothetical protein